jgi:hypothetical protein
MDMVQYKANMISDSVKDSLKHHLSNSLVNGKHKKHKGGCYRRSNDTDTFSASLVLYIDILDKKYILATF